MHPYESKGRERVLRPRRDTSTPFTRTTLDNAKSTPRGVNRVRASTFGQSMINILQLLEAPRQTLHPLGHVATTNAAN